MFTDSWLPQRDTSLSLPKLLSIFKMWTHYVIYMHSACTYDYAKTQTTKGLNRYFDI